MSFDTDKDKQRIIEEYVPGKQVTISHVIASPSDEVYESLGIDKRQALGILTLTPSETAIIAADIAIKTSSVHICFLDRFAGSVVISGDIQSVETALEEVNNVLNHTLKFMTTKVTRT